MLENNVTNSSSFTNKKNFKDFNYKELKTTHSGWVCINYNSEYLRERLCKFKEESNVLRQKIDSIENNNLKEKNYLEKIIISLREDNNFLKKNYEMQKIKLNTLSREKQELINEIKELKDSNINLAKDKEILLEQIKELNNIINNDISPKLKINEKDLIFLQNKINELQQINISLKNEKIRLIDDNNNKSEFTKLLINQNKKLLKEIKMKYNKDLSFIESIEKIGIENNFKKYQELFNKYANDNKNENSKKFITNSLENDIFGNIGNIEINKRKNNIIRINKKNNKNYYINKIKEKINKTECEE